MQHVDSHLRLIQRLRESARSHLGVDLREVQIAAGVSLLRRRVVEMQTGEGKTLTTVIPAAVLATSSRSGGKVLVATANDYLAARDAQWMQPIYRDLGLQVGSVSSASTADQRQQAYRCHVTYGTLRQFAFDYLRDAIARRQSDRDDDSVRIGPFDSSKTLFPLNALIVDEADSILIDEARTPMVISSPIGVIDPAAKACYRWAANMAAGYRHPEDYVFLADTGEVALTERGRLRALKAGMPEEMGPLTTTDILHAVERAVWVSQSLKRDHHYVVNEGHVRLVDEYTGRMSDLRNFGGGIHQAIEAREGLALTTPSQPVARIAVQDFVTRFDHLCGLTATAWEDRRELKSVYGLDVSRFPTHLPLRRTILDPIVCRSRDEKWRRILAEARRVIAAGRSVLIGTRTVEQSESLSERFRQADVDHVVLNARNHREEAAIVARAGQVGRVTIATNMAGRGTDIQLEPSVAAAGGLHVIVSELHAAARIDRQLIGRSARGGDAGSARQFACPDDEILVQAMGHQRAAQIREAVAEGASRRWLLAKIRKAQRTVSRLHRAQRARLTAHEANLAESMTVLGLDPNLDPLPEYP